MSEFIDAILNPVNLVLTVMLGLCFAYWLMVCFGAVDIDAFDVDFDVDVDADVDVDVDVDADVDAAGAHAFPAMSLLKFFNLGEVPLMVLLSVFIFLLWAVGIVSHRYIGDWSVLMQLLILIPMILASLLLTKLATAPLKSIFASLEASQHTGEFNFIGQRCTVASMTLDANHGQVEVNTEGAPIKLNAHLEASDTPLNKGAEVVIVSHDPETGVYRVRGF